MKQIIFILALFIAASVHAQDAIKKVIVETYYVSDANDATDTIGGFLEQSSKTYRVFIQLQKGCKLTAIYGDANHALKFSSTANFFNNLDRGKTFGKDIVKSNLSNNTVALDSWLTLGQTSTTKNATTYFGVLKSSDTDGSFIGGMNNDGGSAGISGGLLVNNDPLAGVPLTDADGMDTLSNVPANWFSLGFVDLISGVDSTIFGNAKQSSEFISHNAQLRNSGVSGVNPDSNQVLVAQLTTKGELSFELNIEVLNADGSLKKYTARKSSDSSDVANSGWLKYPFDCGCNDPNYFEYKPGLACNNPDSCKKKIVLGCMDPNSCNYNPSANYNVQSLCCYPGMCGNRDISLVCPDLGYHSLTLKIFPNPVDDKFDINISNLNSEQVLLKVYNIYGNKFIEKNISVSSDNYTENIDASFLLKGIYYLQITKSSGMQVTKMFVKN
jgi:hypothetical protein